MFSFSARSFLSLLILSLITAYVPIEVFNTSSVPKASADISTGLVGHWKFDEGPNPSAADSSGNGYTGTLVGDPARVAGKIGQALSFDGVDDSVNAVGTDNLLPASFSEFTASFWVKITDANTFNDRALTWGRDSSDGFSFRVDGGLGATDIKLHVETNNLEYNTDVQSNAITDSNWHHLVGRFYNGNTTEIYLDGQLLVQQIGENTAGTWTLSPGVFGTIFISRPADQLPFGGILDDVRIYNRALTDHEIQRLYNGTKPQEINTTQSTGSLADGLAGHWSFDGPVTGPTWTDDISGNGNSGTLTNGPQTTDGKIGQAFEFDGEDAYIAVGNAGSGIQTVSFWMYAHDTTTRDIIDLDGTDQIQLNGGSQITATDFPAATIYVDGKAGSTVTPNTWHHVLVTDTVGVNATALEIGRVTTSNEFDGILDDVRLYDRVLTPHEIQRLSIMGGR